MFDEKFLIFLFLLSIFFAFIIQKIFIKYRKFDDFNHRTSHSSLATKTGGISLFLSLFIFSTIYYLR